MKEKTLSVLLRCVFSLLLVAIVGYALFYFTLPAFNLRSPGFYLYISTHDGNEAHKQIIANGNMQIIAKSKEKTVNVSLIYVTGKHLTYHFESIYKLELYKSTRLAIKPRVRQANIISSKVETRRVSTKNLKWDECADKEQIKLVVFNAFSNLITDTYSHEGLYYGDKISNEAYLYDLKHLDKFTDL